MKKTDSATGQVVAFRNDRLGGRLVMMVNGLRLARALGVPFKINWHQGTGLSAIINDPTEFFLNDFVSAHFIDREEFIPIRENSVRAQENRQMDLAALRGLVEQGVNILVDDGFGFTSYADEDPEAVAQEGADIWQAIPFSSTVKRVIVEIRSKIGPNATAYHIRRGDILTFPRVMNRPWPAKYVYDDLYHIHIEQTLGNGEAPILFSDDDATIDRFKRQYPALIPAASLFDGDSVTPGQADFLELLAMSSCSRIIAPPQSAFSSAAATLGQAAICDVETALEPEQRSLAAGRLLAHLRSPNAAAVYGSGDLGQMLVHLERALSAQGRLREFRPILETHLEAGLEISFLFPRFIEICLMENDISAAISAGRLMERKQVYHRVDYAKGQVLHAFAHLASDNVAGCVRLANIALWHDSVTPYVADGLGALYGAGIMNDGNALPFSPVARSLWVRPVLRLPQWSATSRAIDACPRDGRGRPTISCIDPLIWDWAPMMRALPRGFLAKHKSRPIYEAALQRLTKSQPGPDTESLIAVYDMYVGEKDDWLSRLVTLGAEYPEDAIVQHRLSLAALLAQDFKVSASASEQAAASAPEVPAHTMWRSASRLRQKRYRFAMSDIRVGLDAGLVFPSMYGRLAMAAAKSEHPRVEAAAIAEAIRLAPRDIQLRLYRAQLSLGQNDFAACLQDIDLMLNNDIVPERVLELHKTCLEQMSATA